MTNEDDARQAELNAGRDKLHAAIAEYLDLKYPGSYLEHWVLIMEQTSLTDSGADSVTYEEDATNTWVHRRGLLDVAQQHVMDVQSAQYRRVYGDGPDQ